MESVSQSSVSSHILRNFHKQLYLQFTILLVGYFVLGPSDLYKLVKEVGKFIQNIRTLGSDFSTTLENNMESSLQLNELRKAQRELNDAFSFRRTINVDADSEAFAVGAGSAQQAEAMAMAAMTVPPTGMADDDGRDSVNATTATTINATPKKIRRRIRKPEAFVMEKESIVNNIPESLDMPDLDWEPRTVSASVSSTANTSMSEKELSEIEADFDKYVVGNDATTFRDDSDSSAWFNNGAALPLENRSSELETEAAIVAQSSRFQQQLSGNWNDQILQVGDTLEPLALVMNKIALLEQEKIATLKRLDEEFAERAQVEEKFYQNQRRLLEDAATQVQSAAFGVDVPRNI